MIQSVKGFRLNIGKSNKPEKNIHSQKNYESDHKSIKPIKFRYSNLGMLKKI